MTNHYQDRDHQLTLSHYSTIT